MQAMTERTERVEPFQLKGGSFTLVVLKVIDPRDERFFVSLSHRVRQASGMLKHAPVVIDLSEVPPDVAFDGAAFVSELRMTDLIPVGVTGIAPDLQERARQTGLPVWSGGRPARYDLDTPPPPPTTERGPATDKKERASVLVTEPVRSGKRIHSKGDLVVCAPVSQGAELLAEGNIHIYNTLRGRAIAGINGDRTARIFCQSFEAELVSIAGLYRVSEDIEKQVFGKSVQIYLDADRLRMDALKCS